MNFEKKPQNSQKFWAKKISRYTVLVISCVTPVNRALLLVHTSNPFIHSLMQSIHKACMALNSRYIKETTTSLLFYNSKLVNKTLLLADDC